MADTLATGNDAMKQFCTQLSQLLGEKVSYTGSPAYSMCKGSYYSLQEAELSPVCVVMPTTTEDVATAIKAISQSEPLKFAVRGGGHTSNAGAANIDGGVTINMRSMNSVIVSEDKTFTSIGAGATWGEVYSVLDALGLATSGGRVSEVGVGGLTTGGGISFFSGTRGLVCDNVINYEIVLASGDIVEANEKCNRDLWLALKGGSNNFGVVTRFDIRTFEHEKFYGGVVIYPIDTLEDQLTTFYNSEATFDPHAAILMSFSWSQKNGYIALNNLEYTKPDADPPAIRPFTSIQPQYLNTMRVSTLSDFATESSNYVPKGHRQTYATTTFKNDLNLLQAAYDMWKAEIPKIESVTGVFWAMTIQPIPTAFTSKTSGLGGNSLGLDPGEGPLVLFLSSYTWIDKADDETMANAARNLISQIDETARNRGLGSNFKYLNYAASWQDPIGSYGAANKAHLQAMSKKYDSKGLFQKSCPGGFKLFS